MLQALAQARQAQLLGEVPVGAVVVCRGTLLGVGHNAPIGSHDPTAHAEIAALRAAARHLGNYRLQDCELFVTLEPCVMCAGAILHARLKRVVYGAPDPKAGAAGSVTDVFATPALNHQTHVEGGLMADACAALLQDFFKQQRRAQQQERAEADRALREDALRTPEHCFAHLPAMPAPSHVLKDLPSLAGLRLHYVDTGPTDAPASFLCLHGPQDWSLIWRERLARRDPAGPRWICPDLIGFGRSDKPKKAAQHQLDWHAQVLLELLERLDLQQVTLLTPPGMAPLAQRLAARAPSRIIGCRVEQLPPLDDAARDAPFPDRGHRAALQAFSAWMPDNAQSTPTPGPNKGTAA